VKTLDRLLPDSRRPKQALTGRGDAFLVICGIAAAASIIALIVLRSAANHRPDCG
jgi:hypothetical protein